MMDVQQQRRRSPSAGRGSEQPIRHSPSPHPFHDATSPTDLHNPGANLANQPYNSGLAPTNGVGGQYSLSSPFMNNNNSPQTQFQQHVLPSNDFGGLSASLQHGSTVLNAHANQRYQSDLINLNTEFNDFNNQQAINQKQGQYESSNFLLDPQLQANGQPQDQSINPADIMSNMSSPQNMHPTPPNLMPPHAQSSEPTSPFSNSGHHWSPSHSRQASLDPSSAYMNGHQSEWAGMLQGPQFQGHRRAPSEHSDVSSSVAPSPFMTQNEGFDSFEPNHSPMVHPQPENQAYTDGLNIENFTLSEGPQTRTSPRHSPFVSPLMSPQPGLGSAQEHTFVPLPEAKNGFNSATAKAFLGSHEQFPQFSPDKQIPSNDYGQANQFATPEINVELAPNTQSRPFEAPRIEGDLDSLSPPDRGRRGRMRAKSDTYISRSGTPATNASTLGSNDSLGSQRSRSGSLSPYPMSPLPSDYSRESSPAPSGSSAQRRSSTSAISNRDYILDLADPSRPTAPGMEKRIQKHPATFQCHLCPKKFTRAYNLRSHLRTHTDERPFACSVCNKAFARQHDRKRHEGLHSGEKKFVCKGELGTGTTWGCGRRFARADALGRHFRSEAGRVCIKPLLDEEAMERQRTMDEQLMHQNMQMGGLSPATAMNGVNQNVFTLPAALLAQYPALQGIQWDQMPAGPDDGDISGRSSFDASSGGDYYDDDDEGSGYMSDNPMNPGFETGAVWQGGQGWRSDVEG